MRAVAVALTLCLGLDARAEERVPPELGLMVMLKVVSYDTAFATHGSGDFVVLVPFAPGDEAKATAAASVGSGLEVKRIKERALRFAPVKATDAWAPAATAVLLHPGFPPEQLKAVLDKARAQKLYVLAFDEAAVKDGATLGVGLAGGKPQPLLNIAAARALSADFGAVLRLARTF